MASSERAILRLKPACELKLFTVIPYAAYLVTIICSNNFLLTGFSLIVTALCKQCPLLFLHFAVNAPAIFFVQCTYQKSVTRLSYLLCAMTTADSANPAVMHGLCPMTKQQYAARSGSQHDQLQEAIWVAHNEHMICLIPYMVITQPSQEAIWGLHIMSIHNYDMPNTIHSNNQLQVTSK